MLHIPARLSSRPLLPIYLDLAIVDCIVLVLLFVISCLQAAGCAWCIGLLFIRMSNLEPDMQPTTYGSDLLSTATCPNKLHLPAERARDLTSTELCHRTAA